MDRLFFYHTPPAFALRDRELTLQVAVLQGESVDPFLLLQGEEGEERLRMQLFDYIRTDEPYDVYAVRLKKEQVCGTQLSYCLSLREDVTQAYTVCLVDRLEASGCPDGLDDGDFVLPEQCFERGEEASAPAPVILPIAPVGRHYLSRGDLVIRFAVVGEVEYPTVFVLLKEGLRPFAALPCKEGHYAAVIPYEMFSMTPGRLYYYVQVSGGAHTVFVGNAERPCSVRLVDNAGPAVVESYPQNGRVVQEEKPCIQISYEDASGVDLKRSILCLDGKNVSDKAIWEKTRVVLTPRRGLARGRHVIELSLRDRLGNVSYHRIVFVVGGEAEKETEEGRRGVARSIRTTLFFANVFTTIREFFSDKET